jgi:CBS domain containing-hemolysin-like protein
MLALTGACGECGVSGMPDISDPLRALLSAALVVALGVFSSTGVVLRRARRKVLDVLLDRGGRYGRAMRELPTRYTAYQASAALLRSVLTVLVVGLFLRAAGGHGWRLALPLSAAAVLLAELIPYRWLTAPRPGAVVFFVTIARWAYYTLFPLIYPLHRWLDRYVGEQPAALRAAESGAVGGSGDMPQGAGESERALRAEEREMISRILEFPDTLVREVMVPRTDMVCLDISLPYPDYRRAARESGLSRIPVYEHTVDNIVGVLHVKDLIGVDDREGESLAKVIRRPVFFVPESKRINELFREFRARHQHLAIVLDEYGGTAGLLTLEDVLEEIVGDIRDEFDTEEAPLRRLEDGSCVVDGRLPLEELRGVFPFPAPETSVQSVGGLLVELEGRIPKPGDVIVYGGLEFRVEEADARRVGRVWVGRAPDPRAAGSEDGGA